MPQIFVDSIAAQAFLPTNNRSPVRPGMYLYDDNNIGFNKLVAMGYGWRDMIGDVTPKISGAGSPTLSTITGNIRGFRYSSGDDGDGQFHLQHDYAVGTDIYSHVHWLHIGTGISGAFKVNLFMTYAKGHNQEDFTSEVCMPVYVSTPDIATVPQFRHRIDEVQISAAGGLISSAVNVSITATSTTLTAASSLFTAGDVSRTVRIVGAGVAGGNLDTTISAYTSATQVTLANAASTTVTAQPNFRCRVLNSDNIEVDGVILMHFDVATIPTITGATAGNNEPFINFIDCHYQTDRFATLNKAPNFYT